jgi:hypothetical protein
MSQPDYPLFSKRHYRAQREKRGAYNFEKTKEYNLAEQWFKDRKEAQRELIPVPKPPSPTPPQKSSPEPTKPKGPPPGLAPKPVEPVKVKQEDCELDLQIPSYDDFNYTDPDEILCDYQLPFDFNNDIILEEPYSTPLIIEGDLETNDDDDSYEGQLAEADAQEAALYTQEMYNQFMTAWYIYQQLMGLASMVQA